MESGNFYEDLLVGRRISEFCRIVLRLSQSSGVCRTVSEFRRTVSKINHPF